MQKVALIILALFLPVTFCYSQKLNVIYYAISSDSLLSNHQLEFKNDSLLEISTFPRHMSQQFKISFNYKLNTESITITPKLLSQKDSNSLINNGFKQFLKEVFLKKEQKVLLDESNKVIYVLYDDFKDKYYLTYLIDDKEYKQETGLTDAYGLIKNSPTENKELKKKLDSLKDKIKDYDCKIYRGLEAYRKFGYMNVFGVIELKRRT